MPPLAHKLEPPSSRGVLLNKVTALGVTVNAQINR